MTINGKDTGIALEDLLEAGGNMGLKRKSCRDIIDRVSKTLSDFEEYANRAKIREKTYRTIRKVLDDNSVI